MKNAIKSSLYIYQKMTKILLAQEGNYDEIQYKKLNQRGFQTGEIRYAYSFSYLFRLLHRNFILLYTDKLGRQIKNFIISSFLIINHS